MKSFDCLRSSAQPPNPHPQFLVLGKREEGERRERERKERVL